MSEEHIPYSTTKSLMMQKSEFEVEAELERFRYVVNAIVGLLVILMVCLTICFCVWISRG